MGAMTRATFTIAAIAFLSSAAASQPPVTNEEWNTGLHGTLALGSLPG
jgi:hypothetical protein